MYNVGRGHIYDAKDGVELRWWKESVSGLLATEEYFIRNQVIYGDTDRKRFRC